MQDQDQFRASIGGRPGISGRPVARGDYGLSSRPAVRPMTRLVTQAPAEPVVVPIPTPAPVQAVVPQPTVAPPVIPRPIGPRHMDIAMPAQPVPVQPAPAAQSAIEQQSAQPASQTAVTPLFSSTRTQPDPDNHKISKPAHRALKHARLGVLVVGILLLIGGAVKVVTSGNTTGYTAAVGAVTVNDGSKTTIQFVADDGQLHRFTRNESSRDLTPGTAVQVAYRPGAADATVVQVSKVQAGKKLGSIVLATGVGIIAIIGIAYLSSWLRHRSLKPAASQAVPVSA